MSRPGAGTKRKRDGIKSTTEPRKRRATQNGDNTVPDLEQLEEVFEEEPTEHRQEVEHLIRLLDFSHPDFRTNLKIGISLCRIFSRLITSGILKRNEHGRKQHEQHEQHDWHFQLYRDYRIKLVELLRSAPHSQRLPILHLCWRVLEEDGELLDNSIWTSDSIFKPLLLTIVEISDGADIRETFVVEYMNRCHDCYHHSLEFFSTYISTSKNELVLENIIGMLSLLDPSPSSPEDLNFLTTPETKGSKKQLITPASLKRRAEEAWLSILRAPQLTTALRKSLLSIATTKILPRMNRPETLMDFFTDSYNVGGSTSLLALSGLFHLITAKNLDYPSFYPKLYSLIDADLLQSKHRSKFLRLLNTFLSSPRLPATLIASFIKRLSRRALFAPPAAVVALVPYIYNLLKGHPTCTFMIHRIPRPPYTKTTENLGHDPFDMKERDPQNTGAIDSSLWELETLQSHYHPNVASIARIISEQFTKQQYNIEDFLDHGYGSMLETELAKEPKKEPVVEWRIPKRIFTKARDGEEADQLDESLLSQLWDFS